MSEDTDFVEIKDNEEAEDGNSDDEIIPAQAGAMADGSFFCATLDEMKSKSDALPMPT